MSPAISSPVFAEALIFTANHAASISRDPDLDRRYIHRQPAHQARLSEGLADFGELVTILKSVVSGRGSPRLVSLDSALHLSESACRRLRSGELANCVAEVLGIVARHPAVDDVRRKLADSGADERHAWVWTDFDAPGCVRRPLERDDDSLPSVPPPLPDEITHVWLVDEPTGRGWWWEPDRDWEWIT